MGSNLPNVDWSTFSVCRLSAQPCSCLSLYGRDQVIVLQDYVVGESEMSCFLKAMGRALGALNDQDLRFFL